MDILIVVISLVVLITLHELGHFLFAKKFDVKVHEFGIGIPPRLFGKKIGETLYSINLLPLGGFVRMLGEDEQVENERSFSEKPIWQRAIILVAGVVSFWLIAALLFAFVSFQWGILTEVDENISADDSFLLVTQVEEGFSEELNVEDRIIKVNGREVKTIDQFEENLFEDSTIFVQRADGEKEIKLTGKNKKEILNSLSLTRLSFQKQGPFSALAFGVNRTIEVTKLQAWGIGIALKGIVTGSGLPEGMEFGGPVMIGSMATDALGRGAADYLMFVGIIASILAFMNILPIPALDGGRLLFLFIEWLKGEPISEKVENRLNATFFMLLLALMIVVTVRDIFNIF